MKKQHIITATLTLMVVFTTFHGVEARADVPSIGGDDACGALVNGKVPNPCDADDIKKVVSKAFYLVLKLGLGILFVLVMFRVLYGVYQAFMGDNGAKLKESGTLLWNGFLGILIIVLVFGGIMVGMLVLLGVKDTGDMNPLRLLKLLSDIYIPHAYAAEYLPDFFTFNDVYGLLYNFISLVMRYFVYPALVAFWVWGGFALVAAQGNPEALKKARNLLFFALIGTIVIFMLQGFIAAFRSSTDNAVKGTSLEEKPVDTTKDAGGGRGTGIDVGGTCRILEDCKAGLKCTDSVCVVSAATPPGGDLTVVTDPNSRSCESADAVKAKLSSAKGVCEGVRCSILTGCPYQQFLPIIKEESELVGLDYRVTVVAICRESRGVVDPPQRTGALANADGSFDCGLMQINRKNKRCEPEILDPRNNIRAGVQELSNKILGTSRAATVTGIPPLANAFANYNCCSNGDVPSSQSRDCSVSAGFPAGFPKWACPINPGTGTFSMCAVKNFAG